MATFLLSNAKLFLPSTSSSSSSSSSTFHTQIVCRAAPTDPSSVVTTRRSISLSLSLSAAASLLFAANYKADAAILEADDDEELLEKVKKDRKKRLERQGVISSSVQETGSLLRFSFSVFQFPHTKCSLILRDSNHMLCIYMRQEMKILSLLI